MTGLGEPVCRDSPLFVREQLGVLGPQHKRFHREVEAALPLEAMEPVGGALLAQQLVRVARAAVVPHASEEVARPIATSGRPIGSRASRSLASEPEDIEHRVVEPELELRDDPVIPATPRPAPFEQALLLRLDKGPSP